MSQVICRLCLFKSETLDEIFVEESDQLCQIIADLFHNKVILTKFELDGICPPCRDKLKSFHEYHKFVLENQKKYTERLTSAEGVGEFIAIVKDEPENIDIKEHEDDESDSENDSTSDARVRKKRIQKPRSHVVALQKQQKVFMGILFDFTCNLCPKEPEFDTFRLIYKHYKNVHRTKKVWQCCGKEMTWEIELMAHMMEHKAIWKCELCGKKNKQFPDVVALWKHQMVVHSEPSKIELQNPLDWLKLQYECDLCGSKFRTQGQTIKHMREFHIRNSTCDICHESFFNQAEMNKHRRKDHASIHKVPCPICGIMIRNNPSLITAHIRRVHDRVQKICETCGKVCESDSIYRNHMVRAHKPPKHKCQFCEKRFKSTIQRADHEAIHTGIPRWRCTTCSAVFKSQGNFKAHRRKLHPLEFAQEKLERHINKYKQ